MTVRLSKNVHSNSVIFLFVPPFRQDEVSKSVIGYLNLAFLSSNRRHQFLNYAFGFSRNIRIYNFPHICFFSGSNCVYLAVPKSTPAMGRSRSKSTEGCVFSIDFTPTLIIERSPSFVRVEIGPYPPLYCRMAFDLLVMHVIAYYLA